MNSTYIRICKHNLMLSLLLTNENNNYFSIRITIIAIDVGIQIGKLV